MKLIDAQRGEVTVLASNHEIGFLWRMLEEAHRGDTNPMPGPNATLQDQLLEIGRTAVRRASWPQQGLQLQQVDEVSVTVSVPRIDLVFLCNAFNEALNGIRRVSPKIGTGANLDLAHAIHEQLMDVVGEVDGG